MSGVLPSTPADVPTKAVPVWTPTPNGNPRSCFVVSGGAQDCESGQDRFASMLARGGLHTLQRESDAESACWLQTDVVTDLARLAASRSTQARHDGSALPTLDPRTGRSTRGSPSASSQCNSGWNVRDSTHHSTELRVLGPKTCRPGVSRSRSMLRHRGNTGWPGSPRKPAPERGRWGSTSAVPSASRDFPDSSSVARSGNSLL